MSQSASQSQAAATGGSIGADQNNTPLYILAAVVVTLIVGVVLFLKFKK